MRSMDTEIGSHHDQGVSHQSHQAHTGDFRTATQGSPFLIRFGRVQLEAARTMPGPTVPCEAFWRLHVDMNYHPLHRPSTLDPLL